MADLTEADLNYLRNINTRPGPGVGQSIDPTKPGPTADRIAELEREIAELEAANETSPHWGAAIGARWEMIKGMRAELSRLRNEQQPGWDSIVHELGECPAPALPQDVRVTDAMVEAAARAISNAFHEEGYQAEYDPPSLWDEFLRAGRDALIAALAQSDAQAKGAVYTIRALASAQQEPAPAADAEAERAFDKFAAGFDHESNSWLDMDVNTFFIEGYKAAARAKPNEEGE